MLEISYLAMLILQLYLLITLIDSIFKLQRPSLRELVNLYSPGLGVLSARNANATNANKPCDGFCSQPSGILAGQVGEVILNDGMNTSLSGLTVGSRYFLDTTNGLVTTTAPVAAGNLEQSLGIAITATALRFWTGKQVQH
jgi:hypothetical protein